MALFDIRIEILLKKGVFDSEAAILEKTLSTHVKSALENLACGRWVTFTLEAENIETAQDKAQEIKQRILAHPVISEGKVIITEHRA